jgi:uncharacterized protein YegL
MSLSRIQIIVDTSASMAGAPFVQVRNFIDNALLDSLRSDLKRFGHITLDLYALDEEIRVLCRDVALGFFDTAVLESDTLKVGGPSLSAPLAAHIRSDCLMPGPPHSSLYILISDGHFLDDAAAAMTRLAVDCSSPLLAFGVDNAETPALALFENWPHAAFRIPGEAATATAQDVHELLMRLS